MESHSAIHDIKHCICHTVKKIIDAQNRVNNVDGCATSCEQSIKQILSPIKDRKHKHTTIPFILFNKDSTPFIAQSIFKQDDIDCPDESFFQCLTTPILRAKKLSHSNPCCVVVELLRPVNKEGIPVTEYGANLADFFCTHKKCRIINFQETGICLTLDLNCFCSIQCLEPITPLPACTLKCPPSCNCCDCC